MTNKKRQFYETNVSSCSFSRCMRYDRAYMKYKYKNNCQMPEDIILKVYYHTREAAELETGYVLQGKEIC